uniref:HNH nuclease domain-containing protein n=1 Tax=Moniliophthora roreri TaxID=221103 RepID=A0A0W0FQE3_MONRR
MSSPHDDSCHCEECGHWVQKKDFRDSGRACCVRYFVRYYNAAAPSSSDTGEYQVSSDRPSQVTGTPQKHTDPSFTLSEDRKIEVVNRSRYGQRCMMTRESMHGNRDNHFFHMARRSTPRKMLNHLEPQWGKGLNTLNVDSSSNIGVIQANHHKAFDSGAFMFIPTAEVIESIMAHVEVPGIKEPFDEKFNNEFWTYSFIPLSFNPDRSIFIKHIDENTPSDKTDKFVNAPDYTVCSYPYEHPMIQAIESHIHPFFVILNAGEKIAALENAERMSLSAREPRAFSIEQIYRSWMDGYTGEVATRHLHDGGANDDCMSSLDEGDNPSSADIRDNSDQVVASRDEDRL